MKYALVGEKLSHSLSKVLHNEFFKMTLQDAVYDLIEIEKDNFDNEFKKVLTLGYDGINVTIPYKFKVMDYLDEIDEFARQIGAVNTISFENGIKKGYNTDFYGLLYTYNKFGVEIKNKDIVILGTGGASKAVEKSAEYLNAKSITYVSRFASKKLNYKVVDYSYKISGDVLINATPVGMYTKVSDMPKIDILPFNDVLDLIYNPYETLLLKTAKNMGKNSVNGLYMLVAQGICSQKIWHNKEYDDTIIDGIYEKIKNEVC